MSQSDCGVISIRAEHPSQSSKTFQEDHLVDYTESPSSPFIQNRRGDQDKTWSQQSPKSDSGSQASPRFLVVEHPNQLRGREEMRKNRMHVMDTYLAKEKKNSDTKDIDASGSAHATGGRPQMSRVVFEPDIIAIVGRAHKISEEFQSALSSLDGENWDTSEHVAERYQVLEDALVRYQLWAGSEGALYPRSNPRSLDFRLRNAVSVRERICELLDEITELLQNLMLNGTLNISHDSVSLDDVHVAGDEALAHDGLNTHHPRACEESQKSWVLGSLSDAISRLFKMSKLVRKSIGGDRHSNVEAESLDDSSDIELVKANFGKFGADAWLLERLGKANTRRRQIFARCQDPPKRHLSRTRHEQVDCSEWNQNIAPDNQQTLSFTPTAKTESLAHSQDDTIDTLTGKPDLEQGHSDSVPRLLDVAQPGVQFVCPYCLESLKFDGQKDWKNHVLHDLNPYVCTFEECGLLFFADKRTWVDHENTQHRRSWICPLCSNKRFSTHPAFTEHVDQCHADSLSPRALDIVKRSGSEPVEAYTPSTCKFCAWADDFKTQHSASPRSEECHVSAHKFMKHLAGHLEEVALLVLPKIGSAIAESKASLISNQAPKRSLVADLHMEGYSKESSQSSDGPAASMDEYNQPKEHSNKYTSWVKPTPSPATKGEQLARTLPGQSASRNMENETTSTIDNDIDIGFGQRRDIDHSRPSDVFTPSLKENQVVDEIVECSGQDLNDPHPVPPNRKLQGLHSTAISQNSPTSFEQEQLDATIEDGAGGNGADVLEQQDSALIKPRLTQEQHDVLEAHYRKQTKPTTNTMQDLAETLVVPLDKINDWFRKRRARAKLDARRLAGKFEPTRSISNLAFPSTANYIDVLPTCPSAELSHNLQQGPNEVNRSKPREEQYTSRETPPRSQSAQIQPSSYSLFSPDLFKLMKTNQQPQMNSRPFSYPLPGTILSNASNPSGQLRMVGDLPQVIMPGGFNIGHAAQTQQLCGHPQSSNKENDRPFRCDQCPLSFKRNHDLKRHKRIHLAVKPFPCGHCDKSFSRKDALKRHVLVKGCGKASATAEVKAIDDPRSPASETGSVSGGNRRVIAASA